MKTKMLNSAMFAVTLLLAGNSYAQTSINVLHNFSIKIDFDYRIGKMSFDKPKKKKSVKNEDLKDGGIENN